MKNIIVCVCEDDKVQTELIDLIIKMYFDRKHINCQIHNYKNGETLISDYIEGFVNPDMLFMDIKLGEGKNGIDVCRILRDNNYIGTIIIMSRSKDYAIDCYEIDARAYIVKPYDAAKIYETMDRILQYSSIRTYTIKSRQKITKIPVSDIIYIESQNQKSIIHCNNDVNYVIYKKLNEIENELDDPHFLRCHQSYLVNMDYIVKMEDCFYMENGDAVHIRRKDIKKIRQIYIDHIGGIF